MRSLSNWTDEEAAGASGNSLAVPDNYSIRVYKDNEIKCWTEVGEILAIDGPMPDEQDKNQDLNPDIMRIHLKSVAGANKGKRLPTDWLRIYDALRFAKEAELNALPEGDPNRYKLFRLWDNQRALRKLVALFKATGNQDALLNRKNFPGYGRVLPIIPTLVGKRVTVKLEQGDIFNDGKTRDAVAGYSSAE